MSDIPEAEFGGDVETWLHKWFNPDVVESQPVLDTGRRPDFRIRTPLGDWVVEVENDWNSAANTQTLFYAAHRPSVYVPVTVLPSGHRDMDEYEVMVALHNMVDGYLVELDPDTGEAIVHV